MPNIMYHVTTSSAIALGSYLATQSIPIAMCALATGILIDVDHMIDYRLGAKKDLSMFNPQFYAGQNKIRKVFHSWELLVPFWLICILFKMYDFGLCMTWAFVVHLLSDQVYYSKSKPYFFLVYRWRKRFVPDA